MLIPLQKIKDLIDNSSVKEMTNQFQSLIRRHFLQSLLRLEVLLFFQFLIHPSKVVDVFKLLRQFSYK